MVRPIIHSTKHYVQISRSQVATVARVNIDLILAVESTTANLVDEVAEGAIIKAVFIELWLLDTSNDGSNIVIVSKNASGGATLPNFSQMNALGTFLNKKNILFAHQGLSSNNGVGNPMPVLRGWIKIPKSKQRFGLGDELNISIANNGLNDLEFCGFATYKEYS